MKTMKEIKKEADGLYTKSSHYIAGTFIAIGMITTLAKSVLEIIGMEIGFDYLILAAVLFSPFEYGIVKASLLAYEHKAREVDTKTFTLAGLNKYPHLAIPFIGRSVLIYLVQTIILAVLVYLSAHSFSELSVCLNSILTGGFDKLRVDGQFVIMMGSLCGIILALIVGFLMEAYFSLSYYYVVDHEMGLWDSLAASCKKMSGHLKDYILLRLMYLPYAIVTAVIVNILTISFRTLFQQLVALLPTVPLIVFNLMLASIVAFLNALVAVMIYKVKETLAITVFYKELDSEE